MPAPRYVALAAGLLATLAIVSTYRVFNNMYDEPAHLAAGMEWLSRGTYTLEPQHPPVSRVASALLPYLNGARSQGNMQLYPEGRAILGHGERYERTLTLARLGHLPFFFLLLFVTWTWTRRLAGDGTAAVAVILAAANPNVLAHAGVAGTDMGPAAMMPAALLAWVLWLEQPTTRRSVLLGVTVAICALTKFSALAFWIPAAAGVAIVAAVRDRSRYASVSGGVARAFGRPPAVAVGVAALVTWAVYRFSVGPVGGVTLPAPALWTGMRDFFAHGTGGHPSFLLGEVRSGGWWYYDLVVLAVKTPIPLLVFGAMGAAVLVRSRKGDALAMAPLFGVGAVVFVASLTPVDLGVRLLLAVYPLMAIVAAHGLVWTWKRATRLSNRFVVGAFACWTILDPVAAHPDHIGYFNLFAAPRPERILVDSNLDWGQDLYRLRDVARELRMDSLRVHYFGSAEFRAVGLERTRRLRPHERATGWVAASETFYAGVWADTALHWLRAYEPVGRVGRSIRLYYIPAGGVSPPP